MNDELLKIMDGESYLRFILALVLVLGLLALAAFLLRRSGIGPKMGRNRRLMTLESLPIGPRHRLLLVRRDNVEHLLLLGPQGDLVIERNILPAAISGTGQAAYSPDRGVTPNEAHSREPTPRHFADMIDELAKLSAPIPSTPRPLSTDESH